MIIGGLYSFNGGQEYINNHFPLLYKEVCEVIASVDAGIHKTKTSNERTSKNKILFSPRGMNKSFSDEFLRRGWNKKKEFCDYSHNFYLPEYKVPIIQSSSRPYREMDFVKDMLGIEVQFGKYAFMVYDVCAKMTIFRKLGYINAGIEIVPTQNLVSEMSTGVSYFEQIVWDLDHRGVSDIDTPVLIIGIDAEPHHHSGMSKVDLDQAEPEIQEALDLEQLDDI